MNPSSPALSVVIPLFNEQDNIATLQSELHAALKGLDYEIVFVDDGSKDETVQRVETRADVKLLVFEKNAGQSAAMYAGIHAARGEVIALLDGDLQNDPADIPLLLCEIEKGRTSFVATGPSAKTPWSNKSPAGWPIL